MRVLPLLAALVIETTALAQIPAPGIPDSVGVNIHFVTGHDKDLDLIKAAGFKFVRMDFDWEATEKTPCKYDFSAYDELISHLKERGIRAMFILDYSHPAYEKDGASPRHPESIAAFAKWSAAAAQHFANDQIIWEIFNEPNGGFWHPKPDVHEYVALALATAKAIREAQPNAIIVAPALSGMDWDFLKEFIPSGILKYIDGVSVHPYRGGSQPPETATRDYAKLDKWISVLKPPSKKGAIPIISGEWGYSSNTKGVSLETQAQYAVRQQLNNLINHVPLSIWYDWKNDGSDPNENEHNFGVVTENLEPKPAYLALQKMTRELDGYTPDFRVAVHPDNADDFAYRFHSQSGTTKIVAWTSASPHKVKIAAADKEWREVTLENFPVYLQVP